MTDKERTAAIAFLSNLIDHDAEAWGCAQEIPIFKTALEALTSDCWIPCSEGLPEPQPYDTKFYEVVGYFVTFVYLNIPEKFRKRYVRRLGYVMDENGSPIWIETDSYKQVGKAYSILAWRPLPEPWKGEHDGE